MLTDFDKYQPTLPYPNKADFTTVYYYSRGRVKAERRPGEQIVFAGTSMVADEAQLKDCVTEKVFNEEAYGKAKWAYSNEEALLLERFERDLYKDLEISKHPKRSLLFSKAWDRGHAYGLSEVYSVACDLVDLIKD